MKDRKLKRGIITEELFSLTKDFFSAVILHQFIYWAVRNDDFDKHIEEEKKRDESVSIEPTYGWTYKTTAELNDELMLDMSEQTTRKKIKYLVENGWLDERTNPKLKWDRTLQYRVNFSKVEEDLRNLGYTLATLMNENYTLFFKASILQNGDSNVRFGDSNISNGEAIPETTTETTTKTTTNIYAPESFEYNTASLLLKDIKSRGMYSVKYENRKGGEENVIQEWADVINRILRLDKRTVDEINTVVEWLVKDDWWIPKGNFRTAKKLREYDKNEQPYFDLFLFRANNDTKKKQKQVPPTPKQYNHNIPYDRSIFD